MSSLIQTDLSLHAAGGTAHRECFMCHHTLPLRAPRAGEIGVDWVCKGCDSLYHAVIAENCPEVVRERVRPFAIRIREDELPPPSSELRVFSKNLADKDAIDRRVSVRRPFRVPVATIPLTDSFQPCGKAFVVLSRNISSSGLSFLSDHPVKTKLIAVQLPPIKGQPLQLALRVIRERKLGGFVEFAGTFETRMY